MLINFPVALIMRNDDGVRMIIIDWLIIKHAALCCNNADVTCDNLITCPHGRWPSAVKSLSRPDLYNMPIIMPQCKKLGKTIQYS